MRYQGRITDWNDAKGFGFVAPNGGGDRAFVHIKAFERGGRRPVDGDLVTYAVMRDGKGRLNATALRYPQRARPNPEAASSWRVPRKAIASLFLSALAIGWAMAKLPAVVPLAYAGMSLVAFFAYGMDKSAARHGRWRTQESSLHLIALAGGWPGALLAQDVFRHKSSKTSFLVVFWATVVLNCAALAWAMSDGRAQALQGALTGT